MRSEGNLRGIVSKAPISVHKMGFIVSMFLSGPFSPPSPTSPWYWYDSTRQPEGTLLETKLN